MKQLLGTAKGALLGMILLGLLACAQPPPLPATDFDGPLPAVAAHYRTTQAVRHDGHDHAGPRRTEWRFWREAEALTSENLATGMGESWQRDRDTLFHRKLFHADRRTIEFQMDDLRLLEALPRWQTQALLIDPGLLATLPLVHAGWRDGYPIKRYRGDVDGVRWDVVIRLDLMLPVRIARRQAGREELTELLSAHALAAAPWRPTPTDDYEIIEFADLGDRESDPFVRSIESLLGVHRH